MEQYQSIKQKYPEEILFFRLGDFYEMFYDDARTASRVLGITLTSRFKGDKVVPMAGIPYHAGLNYLNRLLQAGYKVAICEQLSPAEERDGLVERGIVRVITPGTLLEDDLLPSRSHNFLAALCLPAPKGSPVETEKYPESPSGTGSNLIPSNRDIRKAGIAWLDLSTGQFYATETTTISAAMDELARLNPAEYLVPDYLPQTHPRLLEDLKELVSGTRTTFSAWAFDRANAYKTLTALFQTTNLVGFGVEDFNPGLGAAGAVLEYLQQTYISDTSHRDTRRDLPAGRHGALSLRHITKIEKVTRTDYVILDRTTRTALELTNTFRFRLGGSVHHGGCAEGITEGMTNDPAGSLLSVLDKTVTPAGARLLKDYLLNPLRNLDLINQRQDAIAYFLANPNSRKGIQRELKKVSDLERITARLATNRGNPRDLIGIKATLSCLRQIRQGGQTLSNLSNSPDQNLPILLQQIYENLGGAQPTITNLIDFISRAIVDEPPIEIKDGGIIRAGYDPELDKIKSLYRSGKDWISRLAAEEIKRTGIPSLKVGFNNVFGYYIEVTHIHQNKIPPDYIRKQTLKNAERYITPQLKDYETQVLNAEERMKQLEYEVFLKVRDEVAKEIPLLQKVARALAELDVFAALAEVAQTNNYCRPIVTDGFTMKIIEGRHPVLEVVQAEKFIPNDVLVDNESNRILVITGPNMAGKSTYIRQVALLVLMAQMGSFIPAQEAEIGWVDRIFTRVGASDELTRGASTFMVEMNEMAHILNNATIRSLIILDEVGRGTSTFDGVSIAWAITEYLHDKLGSRTLFATHYHELTELALVLPNVKNYHIQVKEWGDKVIFLRKIVPGGTDKSYGIQVARLAGLPQEVINRSKIILANLETLSLDEKDRPRFASIPSDPFSGQLSLFSPPPSLNGIPSKGHPIVKQLQELKPDELT